MNAHVAISRATTVATSSARVSSASARRRNPGKITSAASVASRCEKRVAFAGGARRRGDLTLTRVSPEEQQEAYNRAMAEYSKTPFEYRHDLGLYYHFILPNLVVGTQPTTPEDINRLRDVEGVTCMFDTQQDKDKEHWGVDAHAIREQMRARDVLHVREPFLDFDADSLRVGLPKAVASMDKALREGHVVYCHCTAGMGRSPGVAIAYLYWCLNFESLDQAYDFLTSKRPCGPKKESIRLATCDMMWGHGDALPENMVTSDDPQGTRINEEERWNIVRRLRRSVGDDADALDAAQHAADAEECELNLGGTVKRALGFETTMEDCKGA